jgi:hypothetical protein
MTTKIFNVLDIALMPLNAVRLINGTDELHLLFLEGEASYSLNEITRQTMHGGNRVIGHSLSATLYVPQNSLNVNINALDAFTETVLAMIEFDLGKQNADVTNYMNQYNDTATMKFSECLEMTWRIESSELRPRFIVSLAGFVPRVKLTIT